MRQPEGREVVIVEAVRTPIGRGHKEKGYYKDTHPNELLGKCYSEVISRAGIDAAEVEDVIAGCVSQFGEQGLNVARNAWLQEGLPIETPGTTVDRQCGSAQQAVNFAAGLIAAGVHDAMIGSGVEHMVTCRSRRWRRPSRSSAWRSRRSCWRSTTSWARGWERR
jgi:acetyl-CoA acyltransferase